MRPVTAYILSLFVVVATALSGSFFTNMSVKSPWYKCIRPKITPPAIVFPVVWTMLYIMIAIAFARTLLLSSNSPAQKALKNYIVVLFTVNLLLQVLWTFLYFAKKQIAMAFIVILCLLVVTAILMMMIWHAVKIKVFPGNTKIIVWLLVPFIMWLSFATVLNFLSVGRSC